jgi:3-hydroxyisobutyrate dehydrogenase
LLGIQTAGLAEAVAFAEGAGVDRELLLTALDNSGWRSPVLSFRSEFMRKRSYEPAGFRATLMHKDLQLADEEARSFSVDLPLVEAAAQRFAEAIEAGRGDEDAAVVVELTSSRSSAVRS